MKFKYIGYNLLDDDNKPVPVNSYGGVKIMNGETIELEGVMAEKAMANPDYELVKERAKRKKDPTLGDQAPTLTPE